MGYRRLTFPLASDKTARAVNLALNRATFCLKPFYFSQKSGFKVPRRRYRTVKNLIERWMRGVTDCALLLENPCRNQHPKALLSSEVVSAA
jgi:hypothetical protein